MNIDILLNYLAGISILSHCLSRRLASEQWSSWSSIKEMSWARICVLLVFIDSWFFVFTSKYQLHIDNMLLTQHRWNPCLWDWSREHGCGLWHGYLSLHRILRDVKASHLFLSGFVISFLFKFAVNINFMPFKLRKFFSSGVRQSALGGSVLPFTLVV